MRLKDKVAIVTGAAHGIGRAIAIRFGSEGSHVVVCDINAQGGAAVSQAIVAAGGVSVAIAADVSDKAQVDAMFERARAQFGALDILVNNAGLINPELHFLDEKADEH